MGILIVARSYRLKANLQISVWTHSPFFGAVEDVAGATARIVLEVVNVRMPSCDVEATVEAVHTVAARFNAPAAILRTMMLHVMRDRSRKKRSKERRSLSAENRAF